MSTNSAVGALTPVPTASFLEWNVGDRSERRFKINMPVIFISYANSKVISVIGMLHSDDVLAHEEPGPFSPGFLDSWSIPPFCDVAYARDVAEDIN